VARDLRGEVMAGVYPEPCGFGLAHRRCSGRRRAEASLPTPSGYSVLVKCGCGAEFKRWVTPGDAAEDVLRSALLAFEN
jgi:hypothetical protein